jgi:hypothetical protein
LNPSYTSAFTPWLLYVCTSDDDCAHKITICLLSLGSQAADQNQETSPLKLRDDVADLLE